MRSVNRHTPVAYQAATDTEWVPRSIDGAVIRYQQPRGHIRCDRIIGGSHFEYTTARNDDRIDPKFRIARGTKRKSAVDPNCCEAIRDDAIDLDIDTNWNQHFCTGAGHNAAAPNAWVRPRAAANRVV